MSENQTAVLGTYHTRNQRERSVDKVRLWTIGLLLAAAIICSAQVTITEYPIPTAGSQPSWITAGPDGNLWFTEYRANQIGRVTTAGVITEFLVPTAGSFPTWITAGPDGNLWFTENFVNQIGRITTAGMITEFSLPTPDSRPYGITAGADGNLWFTEETGNRIGRITTAGVITEYPIPTSFGLGITGGPDGNLWFTEQDGNVIGKITTAGAVTEFSIPTSDSFPFGITAGSDGSLWFTEEATNQIGRITTAGMITEYPIPTANSQPILITTGPDGNLWFTEQNVNNIARVTTAGAITEFPVLLAAAFRRTSLRDRMGICGSPRILGTKSARPTSMPRTTACACSTIRPRPYTAEPLSPSSCNFATGAATICLLRVSPSTPPASIRCPPRFPGLLMTLAILTRTMTSASTPHWAAPVATFSTSRRPG